MPIFSVCHPESHGYVALRSADPKIAPLIEPRYLSAPHDLKVLREGLRISQEIVSQPSFDDLRGENLGPPPGAANDEINRYLISHAGTVYHPVGTCKMGNDPASVVDQQLRVRGIRSLRIVDASIMPRITAGNTNAAATMIGEKGADLILPNVPPQVQINELVPFNSNDAVH